MNPRAIALFVAIAVALPRIAGAQAASAQAESLFRRAKQLVAEGKLAEACAAFETSQALQPAATTLINLADCREKNHQLTTAWGLYIDVRRQLRGAGDDASRRLAKVAGDRAARLEPRLSHLTITASAVAGLAITRSGDKLDAGSWNQALPIDGGSYEIVARAPGRVEWSTTVTIAPDGDARTVIVPALAPVVVPPRPRAEPARSGALAATAPRAASPPQPSRVPAVIAVAAGGLTIAGSLVLGDLALRRWNDAKAVCGGDLTCDDPAQVARAKALTHEAGTRAWWATGLGAAGALSLAIGTWSVLRSGSVERDRRVQLAPRADGDSIGLVAWGAF